MTLDLESNKIRKEETLKIKTDSADNLLKNLNSNSPQKKHKRPDWHMRSPIQDVFVRYGEYFS